MCGLAGVFCYQGGTPAPPVLERMTRILEHRGPDDAGYWNEKNLALGHRRLAILDPTQAGRQPMISADGRFVTVYNGEIYNFREIRQQLIEKGHSFRSNTDTEVVVNAWSHWGTDALTLFNGMFAFVIWDRLRDKLVLARDRHGIKPLYYWDNGSHLVFASEIKSILQHPAYQPEVNPEALNEYFTFQNVFSDQTLFQHIHIVPSSHYLEFQKGAGKIRTCRYWDYHFEEVPLFQDEREYVEELDRLFRQAVVRQLYSDVEIGSYLSGGMDSGAITSIAAQNFAGLKTFTAGFDLSSASGLELGYDERDKAGILARHNKTDHHELVLKAGDMEKVMPELIWHLEDLRVGQCYPNYYVHRLASRFVGVVLGGTGGDELFAGYPWRYYRTLVNDGFDHYVDKYYHYWSRLMADHEKRHFFRPAVYAGMGNHSSKEVFRQVLNNPNGRGLPERPEDYINNSLYFESKTFLQGLLMVEDKLSMANSLELRVPFLDNDLVDFAMKVPVEYKLKKLNEVVRLNENEPGPKTRRYFYRTNDGKLLLRKVLNKYVPEQYADGVKQGFAAPDASWFKGESIEYVRSLLYNKKARIYDYLRPEATMSKIEAHLSGRQNNRLFIWSLLSFEWWLKTFIP
jgi:asparagine synthase (glutamine-hydrolysing)